MTTEDKRKARTGSAMGSGAPAPGDRNSLTIGPDGPIVLHDVRVDDAQRSLTRCGSGHA